MLLAISYEFGLRYPRGVTHKYISRAACKAWLHPADKYLFWP